MAEAHHERYLEIRDPQGAVSRFLLQDQPVVVGRDASADLPLESPNVSRHHAEIAPDELGRFSVRDLNSRNGTYVNGELLEVGQERVNWYVLDPGDRIGIGGFSLTLEIATPALDEAMGQEISYVNVDVSGEGEEAGPVATLREAKSVRFAPAQLHAVSGIGLRLLQIGDARERLEALCDLTLREELPGRAAMAVRLSKERATGEPKSLCAPRYAASWPGTQRLHVSRSTLLAALSRNEPVVASSRPGGEVLEMSVGSEIEMAAVACPLVANSRLLDLLYVVLPPDYGTADWLALFSVAARQYELAEHAWRMRRKAAERDGG